MLTEERYSMILRLLEERGAVSVQELTDILGSSESTIRRDLAALHQEGRLNKVHGGATALRGTYHTEEYPVFIKQEMNMAEKARIARHAASLISDYDLVFLDAGTTTGCMAEFMAAKNITVITNGILIAKRLADRGQAVSVTGGRVKCTTEALVGGETLDALRRFNFSVGFFGANGVSLEAGFTTPDVDEARVKTEAMRRCRRCYMLADSSKFGVTTSVTFADLDAADIITGAPAPDKYRAKAHIIEVKG
ncbi:DeoR/GlpR family DNA-binding transcription regulator [Intestinibacillus massiliensis]|nr:DeoR/GlpR family DNA-binding transcription regulator [Intestinibacillus massiliensis]